MFDKLPIKGYTPRPARHPSPAVALGGGGGDGGGGGLGLLAELRARRGLARLVLQPVPRIVMHGERYGL